MRDKHYQNNTQDLIMNMEITHSSTTGTDGFIPRYDYSRRNVVMGKFAFDGMLRGIKTATEAIRLTYGPKGVNAVVENEFYPFHQVANDAQTIIQAIEVEDPIEKRGLAFLKELSDKANKDSGDGRKTTCIIAETILEEGYKSELSGIQLKKELDELIPFIEQKIDEQKKTITTSEVESVATIAGESQELGKTIGEVYKSIGKDGVIHVEGSGTYHTSYSVIEGVRFMGTGYLSPFMVRDEQARKDGKRETKAIYENPTILVTKRKISHLNDINPLLETLSKQNKKDLVIFTDDMDSGVASIMVKAHQDKVMNILIIKAPTLWKQYVFEDFAKVTGSTIVEDASGVNFKNLELSHLGTCARITVDKEETTIIPSIDFSDHVAELKTNDDNDSKLRLSWLQTKTAILKLGANNESELSYLRLKCEDAINSSRLALRDGVVKGGGVCLANVAIEMSDTIAGNIVRNALCEPLSQNMKNMGIENISWGEEIVDASAVVKNAVRNAISLASTVLTTGIVITLPAKTPEQIAAESLKGKGMRF